MKVSVDIDSTLVDCDYGSYDGLRVCCSRCGHAVEVPGTESGSAGYAAIKLREECPRGENNFYDVGWWGMKPSHLNPKS
jgi:hypothetical protein